MRTTYVPVGNYLSPIAFKEVLAGYLWDNDFLFGFTTIVLIYKMLCFKHSRKCSPKIEALLTFKLVG